MILDYQKFAIPDENKEGKNIVCEVNWNQNDPKTNESKLIRMTLPNGDVCIVKKEYLNQILFALGSPEEQRKLLPQKLETVHQRTVRLSVKATKDIRKGEAINLGPLDVSIPCTYIRKVIGEENWNKEVERFQRKGT